jgi:Family of unknown function (DUF6455)
METQPVQSTHLSPIKGLMRWWRDHGALDFRFDEQYEPREIERMAEDVGMSPAELRAVARFGPQAAAPLFDRMLALDIDRSEVSRTEPQTLRDMQRVCTLCDKRKVCARDLRRHAGEPAWQGYCPNAATLLAMHELPWLARNRP